MTTAGDCRAADPIPIAALTPATGNVGSIGVPTATCRVCHGRRVIVETMVRAAFFGLVVSAVAVGLAYLAHPSSFAFSVVVFVLTWFVATIWAYGRSDKG
jgi:hypothetical protein